MQVKGVSQCLVEIIKTYLSDRVPQVGERKELKISCGVLQGSILGPTLWKIFYDVGLDLSCMYMLMIWLW